MVTIPLYALLNHYKRQDIQKAIVACAQDREIAVKFQDKGFGKRPDILVYPRDVLELAKQGCSSFHSSEELWINPLQLSPSMRKQEMEKLRKGWDLLIDIDCKFLEFSKIAADLLIKALRHHGIASVSCKFSGGTGFHIGVPFEAFPEKVHDRETRHWFPEGPRAIAQYLVDKIQSPLRDALLSQGIEALTEKTGLKYDEMVAGGEFNPFSFIKIDTLLISSRHLFRMPYSFNEKTGLVSVPINPDKVPAFQKEIAFWKNVHASKFVFLGREHIASNEGKALLVQAFDYVAQSEKKKTDGPRKQFIMEDIQEAIPEQFFPPCIQTILKGLKDGKKRSVFVLVNFLRSVGWEYDAIEKRLLEWNSHNPEPLRDVTIVGQLRYHKSQGKKVFPPNCSNAMYYKDLGVCCPTEICQRFKNPVNFAKAQVRYLNKPKRKKKADAKQGAGIIQEPAAKQDTAAKQESAARQRADISRETEAPRAAALRQGADFQRENSALTRNEVKRDETRKAP
ncbi:hypothetical protein HYU14_03665 [Candidatus Woesearchaeota archaeon]|nr:hypothetical protein [Candidatus Woesearchaeota archaeon]